jgi:peptidoglycan/xylan/chitin deacetylase (PgdA/CDA1 family)
VDLKISKDEMKNGLSLFISLTMLFSLLGVVFSKTARADRSPINSWNNNIDPQDYVQVYEIKQKPLVSLTFDDASPTVYDVGFPILDSFGIPATFYFLTADLNEDWKINLFEMQNHGWEIGSHTRNHYDLTTLSPADLLTELSQSKMDLEAAGLSITGLAYPYGAGSKDGKVLHLVKKYYSYARSTSPGYNIPIINQYALKTQVQVNSSSIQLMKSWIDTAIANNEWLTINLHSVENSGNVYSITPANLTELANYIKSKVDAGDIYAVTVQEGVTRYMQTYWQRINEPDYPILNNLVVMNGKILWFFDSGVTDYLSDGYEWIKSGNTFYWEWHGDYRPANLLKDVDLISVSPQKAIAEFTLKDRLDGDFQIVSRVSIMRANPLAEVQITQIEGSEEYYALAKNLTRRFSTIEGSLVTDGSIETGMRPYGVNAVGISAFDSHANLIRVIKLPRPKIFSEYSDYSSGEFRGKEINKYTEIPFLWCVGGVPFETLNLLSEAEQGIFISNTIIYTGTDASPRTGFTGIELLDQGMIDLQFSPPYPGNYTLSIRLKGSYPDAQYEYQIDGGETITRNISDRNFEYANIPLPNLSTQMHTLTVRGVNGQVILDYILLFPTSRSSASPVAASFPDDVTCGNHIFLPLILFSLQP